VCLASMHVVAVALATCSLFDGTASQSLPTCDSVIFVSVSKAVCTLITRASLSATEREVLSALPVRCGGRAKAGFAPRCAARRRRGAPNGFSAHAKVRQGRSDNCAVPQPNNAQAHLCCNVASFWPSVRNNGFPRLLFTACVHLSRPVLQGAIQRSDLNQQLRVQTADDMLCVITPMADGEHSDVRLPGVCRLWAWPAWA
jgi:hypothetical protein